jgi:predicted small metal-binding protein
MGKVLRCGEVGSDCDFVACGKTEEEVLKKAFAHAKIEHTIKKITNDHIQRGGWKGIQHYWSEPWKKPNK